MPVFTPAALVVIANGVYHRARSRSPPPMKPTCTRLQDIFTVGDPSRASPGSEWRSRLLASDQRILAVRCRWQRQFQGDVHGCLPRN